MKKILSLVLVIALVLGSFSFAFAAPADVVDTDYETAVEVLMALGVVQGFPDGSFRPGNPITRAEMVALLVRGLGYADLAGGAAPFSDTKGHWAEGYINLANGLGIVLGYPDGTFRPNATLSFDEATALVVRALGYTDDVLRGSWPTNYRIKALELGLLADTTGQNANRGNVAVMLYNALDARLVEVIQTQTGLFAFRFIETAESTLQKQEFKKLIDKVGEKVVIDVEYADVFGPDALKSQIDLYDYMFNRITAYKNASSGEIVFISRVHFNEIVIPTVSGDALDNMSGEVNNLPRSFNGTGVDLVYNFGQATASSTLLAGTRAVVVYDGTIDSNGVIGGVKGIRATESTVTWADAYNSRQFNIDAKTGGGSTVNLPTKTEAARTVLDASRLTIKGDVTELSQIQRNDVVEVYATAGYSRTAENSKMTIVVTRQTAEGTVTRVSGRSVTIGGNTLTQIGAGSPVTPEMVGTTRTVYLNAAGRIQFQTGPAPAPANYALVLGATDQTGIDLGRVRLLLADGTEVVYSVVRDTTATLNGTPAAIDSNLDGSIVNYQLNANGQVRSLVATSTPYDATHYTFNAVGRFIRESGTGDAQFLSNNVVIFNTATNRVIDVAALGSNVTVSALVTNAAGNTVLAMAVDAVGTVATQGIYGYVKSVATVVDPANAARNAQEVVVLTANGEMTYYTVAGETNLVTAGRFVEMNINSAGRISSLAKDRVVDATTEVVDVRDRAIVTTSGAFSASPAIADEHVIVFVVTLDNSNRLEAVSLGSLTDVNVGSFVDQAVMSATNIGTTDANKTVRVIFVADFPQVPTP